MQDKANFQTAQDQLAEAAIEALIKTLINQF